MHLQSAIAMCSAANRMSPMMQMRRGGGMAMLIPDVPWYENTMAGWAGSEPKVDEGMGHGVFEQVRALFMPFCSRFPLGGALQPS